MVPLLHDRSFRMSLGVSAILYPSEHQTFSVSDISYSITLHLWRFLYLQLRSDLPCLQTEELSASCPYMVVGIYQTLPNPLLRLRWLTCLLNWVGQWNVMTETEAGDSQTGKTR